MATIDLERLEGDEVVVFFGGSFQSIDAYTFANSIIALVDAAHALNSTIDPNQVIEIRIVALADGSFKATLKRVANDLSGFIGRGLENLFWAYVAFLLIEKANTEKIVVNLEADKVVVQHGNDRVIIPKSVFEHATVAKDDVKIQKNLSKAFEVLNQDQSVTAFGLTPNLHDKKPLVSFPRSTFPQMSAQAALPATSAAGEQRKRMRTEHARLVILKAWLKQQNRKWTFEWNGVPISAVIADKSFWMRLSRRDVLIGAGDALDVTLKYEQLFDSALGTYVNNHNSFEVVDVSGHVDGTVGGLPGL